MLAPLPASALLGQSELRASEEAVEPGECSESFQAAEPGFSLLNFLNMSLYLAWKVCPLCRVPASTRAQCGCAVGALRAWGRDLCASLYGLHRPVKEQTEEEGALNEGTPCATYRAGGLGALGC